MTTERIDTGASSGPIDAHTMATTAESDDRSASTGAGSGLRFVRLLVRLNLGLVALQAISAGAFLSGFDHAVGMHVGVSIALQLCTLTQAVAAIVFWRRRQIPAWVMGISLGTLAVVFLQAGLGHSHRYWLHVPIGVGLFGGLMRQGVRLDALRRKSEAR